MLKSHCEHESQRKNVSQCQCIGNVQFSSMSTLIILMDSFGYSTNFIL